MKYLLLTLALLAVASTAEANGRQQFRGNRGNRRNDNVLQINLNGNNHRRHNDNVQAIIIDNGHRHQQRQEVVFVERQQYRQPVVVAQLNDHCPQQYNAGCGSLQLNNGYSQPVVLQVEQGHGCRQFLRSGY